LETSVSSAAARNFTKWPILGEPTILDWYAGDTHKEEVDYLNNWICQRIQWLDQELDYSDPKIPDLGKKEAFNIYPNPASGQLFISSVETLPNYPFTIRLFNVNGVEKMEEILVPQLDQMELSIPLPDLIPGLFILEISNEKGSSKWKVVIN